MGAFPNRHWDINGDGRLDERELHRALSPLVGAAASGVASQVLALARAGEGRPSLSVLDLGLVLSEVRSNFCCSDVLLMIPRWK